MGINYRKESNFVARLTPNSFFLPHYGSNFLTTYGLPDTDFFLIYPNRLIFKTFSGLVYFCYFLVCLYLTL